MIKKALTLISAVVIAIACQQTVKYSGPTYLDQNAPLEDRIQDAISRMTLEEKVAVIHAQSKFSSAGVPRLGIPELWCTDGPHGIRAEVLWDEWSQAGWTNDSCVAYPALTALAATWNPEISALYGKSIGEEARYREKDVLLGPGVNIYRTPLGGRNFEYMGEDPYLASKMVVPYVQEVQKNGVAVCVKHFCLNNMEENRHGYDVVVSDRALYEIYLPAFKAAVLEGGAWSIMGAYNLYKGQHLCTNQYILNDILKGEWAFDGAVISDWGGVHDTDEAITNGMDLEFGTWTDGLTMGKTNAYDNYFLAQPYLAKLRAGETSEDILNEKVARVLRLMMRTAMNPNKPFGALCSDEHIAAARKIGDESIVLLKNDGDVLPVDLESTKKLLVVGENAVKMMTVGGGSSSLKVKHEVLPLEAIKARVGDAAEVIFERGYIGDVGGAYDGVTTGQDLRDARSEEQLIADAVAAAKEADAVIFIGGLNKADHQDCEGTDRRELGLPYAQDKLIAALAEANEKLAVVIISGNAVAMPWVEQVPAIVESWYGGSQAGNSLADVLFGDVNPSGHLPFTFPVSLDDTGVHSLGGYPEEMKTVEYKEGLLVGYRWADTKNVKPLFAFGHGLSYTTFEWGEAKASANSIKSVQSEVATSVEAEKTAKKSSSITFKLTVKNTGKRAGAELVQLYISDSECSVERPQKELKAFQKVYLQPGESKEVELSICEDDLRFFDETKHAWVSEKGEFNAIIAASATDIRQTIPFTLK
ncbi:MAG: glycoside hydrolase family 3 C-terminal domain-containing protein [Bacteroidales bacterium]|nr:glycoside hydrolase family 3 C-terminal domain-containing protein [Bacteroidales bacterium]